MIVANLAEAIAARSKRIFAVPGGGTSLDLIDAVEGLGVDVVTPHHEAAAGIMAATAGRISGSPGFALSIKGPGLANMLPGLSLSALENWPMVALCEAYAQAVPPSKAHKRTDHRRVTDGIVKAHGVARDQQAVAHAASIAAAELPGAVTLDLVPDEASWTAQEHNSPTGDECHDQVLAAVHGSERPVVILGSLALRSEAISNVAQCGVPVLTTAAAKGVVAESAPNAAGVFTGVGLEHSPEWRLLKEADLVIGFGLRAREILGVETHGTPVVIVDPLLGQSAGLPVVATGGLALTEAVSGLLVDRPWGEDLVAHAWQHLEVKLLRGAFLPAIVARNVQEVFGPTARLIVDTGDFCTAVEHVWKAEGPDRYLGAGQSRFMGVGVATALSAALHDRSCPTFLAVGDGGIGPSFGELTLAVERGLPMAVLFMRDGSLASIRGRALIAGRSTTSLQRATQRWTEAAAGLGFDTATATDAATCDQALRAWQFAKAPLFLECRFDPDDYLTMTQGLR